MRINRRRHDPHKKLPDRAMPALPHAIRTGGGVAAIACAALFAVLLLYPLGARWQEVTALQFMGSHTGVAITYGNAYNPTSPISWLAMWLNSVGVEPKREPWKPTGIDYGNTRVPRRMSGSQVYLTWQYRPKKLDAVPPGVNVLAPTWFYVESNDGAAEVNALDTLREGKVKNWDPAQYVATAHAGGAEVWASVVSFDPDLSKQVVTDAKTRKAFIAKLAKWVEQYELDGINFDFEKMDPADKAAFNKLLAECKQKLPSGSVISACVTVPLDKEAPNNWWQCYDRKGMGEVVDYVAVMAYDNPDMEPVAAIDWVAGRMRAVLDQVPEHKLLLGVPFYGVDMVFDNPGGGKLTALPDLTKSKSRRTMTPAGLRSILTDGDYTSGGKKITVDYWVDKGTWLKDKAISQYAFVDTDGKLHLVYCEDVASLAAKGRLLMVNRLAGAAVWRAEFGSAELWGALQTGMRAQN